MPGVKFNDARPARFLPFSLHGHTTASHFREILSAAWENRKQIPYAWNILNHSVCDGCSLGAYGLRENGLDGLHLCPTRLRLLRQNTMDAVDLAALSDVSRLRNLESRRLRSLGRLAFPMIRRQGQRGFLRVPWDEALSVIARGIRQIAPHEMAFFVAGRGLTNEAYYVIQKLARTLGTNNIDLCSPWGHAASVSGLKATLGFGASTCSLSDIFGTDLLVIFGSDFIDSQPAMTKYLHHAHRAGTRVIIVNSVGEDVQDRAAAQSHGPGATFGSEWNDYFEIRLGGDKAFINGILKFLILAERIDRHYIERHTAEFAKLASALETQSWDMLERRSGVAREAMQRFAESYSRARSALFVYSEDVGQSSLTVDSVKAVVNLALARGMMGREKCGILAIHKQSGVFGASECGVAPDSFPGGFLVKEDTARRFSNLWHHPVPSGPGLKPRSIIDAARQGHIKFIYSMGGDLLETARDRNWGEDALSQVPLRVHQDMMLNKSMLLEGPETVVLLPGQTRYEQRTGGISSNTERRIRFTPEIPGHEIGESRPDWEIPVLIGRKSMSNGDKLFPFDNTQAIREEMSRIIPIYQGVEQLTEAGDQLQWGGPQLYKDGFTTMPDNRARFTILDPEQPVQTTTDETKT